MWISLACTRLWAWSWMQQKEICAHCNCLVHSSSGFYFHHLTTKVSIFQPTSLKKKKNNMILSLWLFTTHEWWLVTFPRHPYAFILNTQCSYYNIDFSFSCLLRFQLDQPFHVEALVLQITNVWVLRGKQMPNMTKLLEQPKPKVSKLYTQVHAASAQWRQRGCQEDSS